MSADGGAHILRRLPITGELTWRPAAHITQLRKCWLPANRNRESRYIHSTWEAKWPCNTFIHLYLHRKSTDWTKEQFLRSIRPYPHLFLPLNRDWLSRRFSRSCCFWTSTQSNWMWIHFCVHIVWASQLWCNVLWFINHEVYKIWLAALTGERENTIPSNFKGSNKNPWSWQTFNQFDVFTETSTNWAYRVITEITDTSTLAHAFAETSYAEVGTCLAPNVELDNVAATNCNWRSNMLISADQLLTFTASFECDITAFLWPMAAPHLLGNFIQNVTASAPNAWLCGYQTRRFGNV